MSITTKQCFKCSKTKPLTAYYKHRKMNDGHLGKCKQCTKLDSSTHRNNNLDKVREYDRNTHAIIRLNKEELHDLAVF